MDRWSEGPSNDARGEDGVSVGAVPQAAWKAELKVRTLRTSPSESLSMLSWEKLQQIQMSFATSARELERCTEEYAASLSEKFQACAVTLQMLWQRMYLLRESIESLESLPARDKKASALYGATLLALEKLREAVDAEIRTSRDSAEASLVGGEASVYNNLRVNLSAIHELAVRQSLREFSKRFSNISHKILQGLKHDGEVLREYTRRLVDDGGAYTDVSRLRELIKKMQG